MRDFVINVVRARAPTRIDFGGGWTDVPPYSDEVGGFVCNVAIDRYATVTVAPRGGASARMTRASDRSIASAATRRLGLVDADVSVESDFPIGAGLGGSSAAGVATAFAICAARGDWIGRTALAELSRDIEISDLGIPGGRQDHYAAAYGGALGLRFGRNSIEVLPITLSTETRAELERRCFVVYTGESRISGDTIEAVIGAYGRSERRVLDALDEMRRGAERMAEVLADGDVDAMGSLVADQWRHQRSLHPAIPTPRIDEIIERAQAAGGLGAKALGASGGGCVLVVARRGCEAEVRGAIAPLGELLDFHIAERGVERCP